ncbi:MAG: flagellar hook basal-body protein [Phycisphaerales bacterium]|nr:flagellar hook basal-body protein [Phycisphaerales bacterium]
MNYGIQISASGALTSMHRQDAYTGNLANLGTAGFKPIFAGTQFRQAVRQEDGLYNLDSNELLERLGAGAFAAPNRINFAQGPIEITTSATDVAIKGEGFFVVGHEGGQALSRDGRLTLNADGTLVQAATGRPVLDPSNTPIQINPNNGDLVIHADGLITQEDAAVGQLALADVPDRSILKKHGEGLFVSQYDTPLSLIDGVGQFNQYAIEGSAVNEINAIMQIQSASRSAQGNIGMIDMQNRMMDRTINTFGRIA